MASSSSIRALRTSTQRPSHPKRAALPRTNMFLQAKGYDETQRAPAISEENLCVARFSEDMTGAPVTVTVERYFLNVSPQSGSCPSPSNPTMFIVLGSYTRPGVSFQKKISVAGDTPSISDRYTWMHMKMRKIHIMK